MAVALIITIIRMHTMTSLLVSMIAVADATAIVSMTAVTVATAIVSMTAVTVATAIVVIHA